MNVVHLLGLQGPWQRQVFRDTDCLHCRSYGPNRVFFQASYSWQSERFFGQSFSVALPVQALRGFPCLRSFSIVQRIRHIEGVPWLGSYSVVQCLGHLVGLPLYCSAANAGVWGERGYYGDGSNPLRMTQQYRLASMAAQLSSTGISHHNLLPHILSIHLSTVNSSPCPGITSQSLNSSSQPLPLPWDLHPCPGYVWMRQGLSDSHSI